MSSPATLEALEREVVELRSVVTSLARTATPPAATVTKRTIAETATTTVVKETSAGPGFTVLAPEAQVEIASGTDAVGATAADLSGNLPSGSRYAYVRFSGHATEDARTLAMHHRPGATGAWTTALHIVAIEEAADTSSNDNSEWIVLAGDLSFQYEIVSDSPAPWSLTLLGYA